MNLRSTSPSRRAAIIATTNVFLRAAAVVMIVPSQARAKAPKADFYYQEKPKEGKACSTCRLFAPVDTGKGTCAVVEGDIAATGWCMAYSPRS